MSKNSFLKENGLLLSKFEEVNGRILLLKSMLSQQESKISGLEYQLEEKNREILRLEEVNRKLRSKVSDLEFKIAEESNIIPQNFKIKNKLVKIVSDIEEEGQMREVLLSDYLDTLIEEIGICIDQLSK